PAKRWARDTPTCRSRSSRDSGATVVIMTDHALRPSQSTRVEALEVQRLHQLPSLHPADHARRALLADFKAKHHLFAEVLQQSDRHSLDKKPRAQRTFAEVRVIRVGA